MKDDGALSFFPLISEFPLLSSINLSANKMSKQVLLIFTELMKSYPVDRPLLLNLKMNNLRKADIAEFKKVVNQSLDGTLNTRSASTKVIL